MRELRSRPRERVKKYFCMCCPITLASANQRAQLNSKELPSCTVVGLSLMIIVPDASFPPSTLPAQQHIIWHRPTSLSVPHVAPSLILTAHPLPRSSLFTHTQTERESVCLWANLRYSPNSLKNNNNFQLRRNRESERG